MKFYRTLWTTDEDRAIEGRRSHELPMVTCPKCGNSRGVPGIAYPWIKTRGLFDKPTERGLRQGDSTQFTWDEFVQIRETLRHSIKSDYPLPPGAEFGLFSGKVYARPILTDFVMPGESILIARSEVVENLSALRIQLETFPVKLKGRSEEARSWLEIWAPPLGKASRGSSVIWCNECERGLATSCVSIDEGSLPPNTHLFTLIDSPYFLVLSSTLVEAISRHNFSGLKLAPIAVG